MSTPNPTMLDESTILGTVQASRAAMAAGRTAEAEQTLVRLAQQAPGHPAVLNELGVLMMGRGAAAQAAALFTRATQVDSKTSSLWSNLANSLRALGRRQEEREALEKALALDPRHVASLLQKASLFEDSGDPRNAARIFQQALSNIPKGSTAAPAIRELVEHAKTVVAADQSALGAALEERLSEIRARHGGRTQRRVDQCLEMLTGRRSAFFPRPTFLYFPEMPAIEFFERSDFPWLDPIEAAARRKSRNPVRAQATLRLQPHDAVGRKLDVEFLGEVQAREDTRRQSRKSKGDSENARLKGVPHDAVNELLYPGPGHSSLATQTIEQTRSNVKQLCAQTGSLDSQAI